MEKVIPFLLILIAGFSLKRLSDFPKDTALALNLYVIYIALPALIFVQVPKIQFSTHLLVPVILPWLVVLVSATLVLVLSFLFRFDRETTGALLLLTPLGNTAFLGIPMVEQFFGSQGIPFAVLYDQLGSFLALTTYGTLILSLYAPGHRPTLKDAVRKVISFPPFIALILALIFKDLGYPLWLDSFFKITAASLVPVVLVSIGFQLEIKMPVNDLLPFATGLIIRLLITPIIFILSCHFLGFKGLPVQVALLEAAMPPMVVAGAMAAIAGLRPNLASSLVGLGIIFSFLTLPIIYKLIVILIPA
ncbi:Auxin Efflux Carrier [Thermodesulfatator indicus DSM 15286]|uniref:Auxin Efflux Carrier n=1 Tax=Thermodesulfatator indicus (strain DSM 15286 / JCM 11887 / CIR29812) TaxID=667014 RepID=F8A883_THEID|nr:AEC family transporter [Thermodesulfatator indicus]AEH44483.1 Auxin Efflux Carrier [Thermodesulfatator indicus DSM 15286]